MRARVMSWSLAIFEQWTQWTVLTILAVMVSLKLLHKEIVPNMESQYVVIVRLCVSKSPL